jgi:hypothetical protein
MKVAYVHVLQCSFWLAAGMHVCNGFHRIHTTVAVGNPAGLTSAAHAGGSQDVDEAGRGPRATEQGQRDTHRHGARQRRWGVRRSRPLLHDTLCRGARAPEGEHGQPQGKQAAGRMTPTCCCAFHFLFRPAPITSGGRRRRCSCNTSSCRCSLCRPACRICGKRWRQRERRSRPVGQYGCSYSVPRRVRCTS